MTGSPWRDDAGTIPCPVCQARFTPTGRSTTAPPPAARPPGAAATRTGLPRPPSRPPGPAASSPSTNAPAAANGSTGSSAAPTAASSPPASAPAGPARTAANPSPSPTCSRRWSPRPAAANLSNDSLNAQPSGEFQRSALGIFQDRRHRCHANKVAGVTIRCSRMCLGSSLAKPQARHGQPSLALGGHLSAQDSDLMPEHEDLRVLSGVAARQEHQPDGPPAHEEVDEADEHERRA